MTDTNGKTLKSTHTTLDILEALVDQEKPSGAKIASDLDYSRSAIHYHLKTLQQRKYVVYEDGHYRLGLKTLRLSGAALAKTPLYPHVERAVERLYEETGMFSRVMASELDRGVYVAHVGEPPEAIADHERGTEEPLDLNAFGRAILAFLPEEDLMRITRGSDHVRKKSEDHPSEQELLRQLSRIEQRKLAFDNGDRSNGIRNIASPVIVEDEVVGSIGVSSESIDPNTTQNRLKARRFAEEEPELVRGVARDLGERIEEASSVR